MYIKEAFLKIALWFYTLKFLNFSKQPFYKTPADSCFCIASFIKLGWFRNLLLAWWISGAESWDAWLLWPLGTFMTQLATPRTVALRNFSSIAIHFNYSFKSMKLVWNSNLVLRCKKIPSKRKDHLNDRNLVSVWDFCMKRTDCSRACSCKGI